MKIEKKKAVSFSFTLKDEEGTILEQSDQQDPMVYLHGYNGIVPGLENALEGKQVGDSFSITLDALDAYGPRNPSLLGRISAKHIHQKGKLKPGMMVQVQTKEGVRSMTIVKAGKFMVDVDGNHPFAGKTLSFDVEVTDIREATGDEISHGHIHGEHCHH